MSFKFNLRGYLNLEDVTRHIIRDSGDEIFIHPAPRASKRDMSMSVAVIVPSNKFDSINYMMAFNQPLKGAAVYFQNHRKTYPECLIVFYGKLKWCRLKTQKLSRDRIIQKR